MHVLDVGISLVALLALCVFYAQRGGLGGALAPLASVCTAVLFLVLGGVMGFLLPAAFLFTALCLALGLFTFVKIGPKTVLKTMCVPGFLFFLGLCLLALVWFAVKEPVFSHWDEFSFWGTAVKLMKLSGGLYTTAETGWFWTSTEMPALPVLGWFVQFMGATFAPWKVYFGYSVLLFACFAALLGLAEKNRIAAISMGVCAVLLPFFFLSPQRITELSQAYLSAYGDLPAGVLFGGALAFYFARRMTGKSGVWALLPLAVLALVKDNTFPIALVAAALMATDTLFFSPAWKGKWGRAKKGLLAAAYFAAPVAAYFMWKAHAGHANAQNVVTQGQATGASPFSAVGQSVAQLVGVQPRSEGFERTLGQMLDAFQDSAFSPVSMVGSGLLTTLLVLFLFAVALVLAKGKTAKLRVGLAAGLSTAGFFGFQFVLLTYFAFLNKYEGGLPDYERYSVSYFAGWLMLALCLVAWQLFDGQKTEAKALAEGAEAQGKKASHDAARPLAAQSLLVLTAVGAALLFGLRVLPGYSVLDYPQRLYDPLRSEQAAAEALAAQVPAGERTFYIRQGDDGFGWFRTHYYFLPRILDYSEGGGSLRAEETGEAGELVMEPEELQTYLRENNCTYIYVGALDDAFVRDYAQLFTDGLRSFEEGPQLYKQTQNGLYAPVSA